MQGKNLRYGHRMVTLLPAASSLLYPKDGITEHLITLSTVGAETMMHHGRVVWNSEMEIGYLQTPILLGDQDGITPAGQRKMEFTSWGERLLGVEKQQLLLKKMDRQ